jgi:hypothetical protein
MYYDAAEMGMRPYAQTTRICIAGSALSGSSAPGPQRWSMMWLLAGLFFLRRREV